MSDTDNPSAATAPTQAERAPGGPGITCHEQTLHTPDQASLYFCRYTPATVPVRASVLIIHGYMEHSGRYLEFAHHLAAMGIACCTVDLRGHGQSNGKRGFIKAFSEYRQDLTTAFAAITTRPCFVLGHSNGGLVALDAAMKGDLDIAGLILTNPFLGLTRPASGPKLWLGVWAGRTLPSLSLPSGVDAADLTHDVDKQRAHRRDPLNFSTANAGWYREVTAAQHRLLAQSSVACPVLYIYSDADPVASPTINRTYSALLQSPDKTVMLRQGERHEVLNETQRVALFNAIGAWILARCPNTATPDRKS